jgi:hypothetical protein
MLTALALTIDLGIGISQGAVVADGFWVQSALPHRSNLTSPAWRAGVTYGDRWRFGLHYVDVGASHIDAWGTSDSNYDRYRHKCVAACGRLDHFVGVGSANGISTTIDRRFGSFSAGVGAYVYQPYWVETIDGTRYANTKTAWHVGPSAAVAYHQGPLEIRLDDYLTCVSNRCKTERTPGPWGSVNMLSVNWSWK